MSTNDNSHWINPINEHISKNIPFYRTGLKVKNSLSPNENKEFATLDGSKNVKWYMCGPTVYDLSHLGHARTYIGFDIIRRLLQDYFGYNVELVMNITDIDDKIIKRCIEQKIDFTEFTQKYESLFFYDMERLNIQYPDRITRVTEYVPEIISFIEKLISNGYAYSSNGSVYFSIDSFTKNGHTYAKLDPSKIGCKEIEHETDGVLGIENKTDKCNANDFALWKKSKENEPFWESPWGKGRPGWHIECSVMATEVLGDRLDIHSGGFDLKFPHHDNEIAQTEGYYNSKQWINYFLHTGHLNIEGLKMSKSLKNFLTIDQILQQGYTANSFRIQFLNHKYDTEMNYTVKDLDDAYERDKKNKEFFRKLKTLLEENNLQKQVKFTSEDLGLNKILNQTKAYVHDCLIDNFNTKPAIHALFDLISEFYKYEQATSSNKSFNISLGYSVGKFVSHIFKCFGLVYQTDFIDCFNFTETLSSKVIEPYVKCLSDFRDKVRESAKNKDFKSIFEESDRLRDEVLPYLGVRMKDRPNENAVFSIEDKDELIKEVEMDKKKKVEAEEAKRKEKELKERMLNTPAKEWYASLVEVYGKYDNDGIPTQKWVVDEKTKEKVLVDIKKEEYNKLRKEFNSHQDKYVKNSHKSK